MNTEKVVIGILAGFAIGAIAGILFAPDKGSITRKQILAKSGDYSDDLKAMVDDFVNSITEKFDSTKNEAKSLASTGESKFDEVKKEFKNATLEIKDASTSEYHV